MTAAVAVRPLYRAAARIWERDPVTEADADADAAAIAAIEAAMLSVAAATLEDLAAQILVATRDGDFGVPPTVIGRLRAILAPAGPSDSDGPRPS